MLITHRLCVAAAAVLVSARLLAQTPAAPGTPAHIATRNGEVILPTSVDKQNYDEYGFAAVRRAGNWAFISGAIVGRRQDEGTDVGAFKAQTRRGFRRLDSALKAAGLGDDDVVMINSFGRVRARPPFALRSAATGGGLRHHLWWPQRLEPVWNPTESIG